MSYATGAVAFSDPTERLPSWGGGSLNDEGSPPFLRPCRGHPHGVVPARAHPRSSTGRREVPAYVSNDNHVQRNSGADATITDRSVSSADQDCSPAGRLPPESVDDFVELRYRAASRPVGQSEGLDPRWVFDMSDWFTADRHRSAPSPCPSR